MTIVVSLIAISLLKSLLKGSSWVLIDALIDVPIGMPIGMPTNADINDELRKAGNQIHRQW